MKCLEVFVCLAFFIGTINALLKPRIIGGETGDIKDFPYQASIRVVGRHFCGGTIISHRHILTAAHCFTNNIHPRIIAPYVDVTVSTGTSSSSEIGQSHRVYRVTIHPRWTTKSNSANDIAIITIAGNIAFDETQQKATLPSHDVITGTKGYMTGWGFTSTGPNPRISIQLKKLQMTLLTTTDCERRLPMRLDNDEICAYHSEGNGCCTGDSGGPLVVDNKIVGIVSWIYEEKYASGMPEMYSNVYFHREFIASVINK